MQDGLADVRLQNFSQNSFVPWSRLRNDQLYAGVGR